MYSAQPMLGPQPRCCGCIPLRIGSGIICVFWAGISMYLAVLSFQNSSLFYSYMAQAPIMVYGVVNLILSLVSIGGIVILIIDRGSQITTLSHAIWVCVFLVLVDGLVNVILFIINESDYHSWCINSSSSTIQNDFSQTNNSTSFNFQNDYYNCHHMWQDELKFGIISYILMFAFYIYWSMCIYSFRLYRPEYISDADIRHAQSHNMPLMGAPSMPQTAMINNPAAPAGPYPPDRSVIVLNNHKPSKKKSKFDSFKHIKKSMRPNRTVTPLHRNDSQFTIGFKLGPDGKIIDIESAPSPTPTYTAVDYFKRKPIQEDDEEDENDDKYYY